MDKDGEQEPEPLMVIHVYREEDGTLLVSEQRFFNHTIYSTTSRKKVFREFWKQLACQLAWLERDKEHLGEHLTEELAYLRKLCEMGLIKQKGMMDDNRHTEECV